MKVEFTFEGKMYNKHLKLLSNIYAKTFAESGEEALNNILFMKEEGTLLEGQLYSKTSTGLQKERVEIIDRTSKIVRDDDALELPNQITLEEGDIYIKNGEVYIGEVKKWLKLE